LQRAGPGAPAADSLVACCSCGCSARGREHPLLTLFCLVAAAVAAREAGSTRFCMGAAWRGPSQVGPPYLLYLLYLLYLRYRLYLRCTLLHGRRMAWPLAGWPPNAL
jgi:hypothetical protein